MRIVIFAALGRARQNIAVKPYDLRALGRWYNSSYPKPEPL